MGGGNLNSKKSWHPSTLKNQEKLWKAEQSDKEERRKLNELQKEISEERDREQLNRIVKNTANVSNSDDQKLEWMYKGSSDLVNREEYLLGRTVDKNFELLEAQEKDDLDKKLGVTIPKNHVEHECIPFSIRSYRNLQNTEQVDLQRKILEDPLMAIKQKEMESRRKILENPVKLKELHRILKLEKKNTVKSKKEKKVKKNKRSKEKNKRKSESRSSCSSSDELDALLEKKYRQVQDEINKGENGFPDLNLSNLLKKKYDKLYKELDKAIRIKKKSKKKKSNSSDDGNVFGSSTDYKKKIKDRSVRIKPSEITIRSSNNRSRSGHDADKYNSEKYNRKISRSNREYDVQNYRDKAIDTKKYSINSPYLHHDSKTNPCKLKAEDNNSSEDDKLSKDYGRYSKQKRNATMIRSRSRSVDYDSNNTTKRNYGLTSADGKKMEINYKSIKEHYKLSNREKMEKDHNYKFGNNTKRLKLTEEEKEKKLREMQKNAEWRNSERERNVTKYREEYDIEQKMHEFSNFDKNFINKELHKAMANQKSVESRIKSNINNIQRSGRAMDSNFARR